MLFQTVLIYARLVHVWCRQCREMNSDEKCIDSRCKAAPNNPIFLVPELLCEYSFSVSVTSKITTTTSHYTTLCNQIYIVRRLSECSFSVSLSDNNVQNYDDEELLHNTLQSNIWYDVSLNAVSLSDMSKTTTTKSYNTTLYNQIHGMTPQWTQFLSFSQWYVQNYHDEVLLTTQHSTIKRYDAWRCRHVHFQAAVISLAGKRRRYSRTCAA